MENKIQLNFKFINIGILIFAILSIIFPTQLFAAATKEPLFPGGCRPAGFVFKHKVLRLLPNAAGNSQSLFFIHNKTMSSVKLYQMRTGDEPFIMHLNNTIRPNQWGVFASDEKVANFICTKPNHKSKYGNIIDCSKALELCEYTNVKFSINNHGNYWAVRSNAKYPARRQVINQGVLLRW